MPSGSAIRSISARPPTTRLAVIFVAFQTIGPTAMPTVPPLKSRTDPHETPKSPWSARHTNFAYCVVTGRSTPSSCRACAICAGDACSMSTRKPAGSSGTLM
jgi:hypothetical protein